MQFVNLTVGASGTNAASYTTASVSPTNGSVLLLAVETDQFTGDAPTKPTISGLGAFWTELIDCYYDQSGTTHRLTVFMGLLGTYTPGALTIDYGGVTQGGACWVLDEAHTPHNADVIVQYARSAEPGSGATSVTLSPTDSVTEGNALWAAVSIGVAEGANPETNWTKLGQTSHTAPTAALITACLEDVSDSSVTFSWATSAPKGAVIVEIHGAVPVDLHSSQDDLNLRAQGDTERSEGDTFVFEYYLTDTAGNYLTDTAGNRLVARTAETLYPQTLHAFQDDLNLRAE